MKRFLSILLVAVLAVGMMATSAFAAGVTVEAKETTVTLKATDVKFQSCLATINFDHDKLTLKNVEAGEIIAGAKDVSAVTEASEVEGVTSMFAWNADNAGKAMIAYASGADVDANGIMFTLTFEVKAGVTEADVKADVVFYDANQTDGEGKIIPIEATTSDPAIIKVEATGFILGDINGDGKVNRADRNYLIKALAGWDGYPINDERAADVNKDGKVNRADRNYLIKALAGWEGYTL